MDSFLSAHVQNKDWKGAVDDALEQLGSIPQECHLGFIYLTDELARHSSRILERLKEKTPVQDWIGTVGVGVCGSGRESFNKPALVLFVTDIDESRYRIIQGLDKSPAKALIPYSRWRNEHHAYVGIVHADPRNPRTLSLIEQLAHAIDGGFLVGGISSGNEDSLVQFAGSELTAGGLSGVLLSGQVAIASGLSQGCGLIGEPHSISGINHNVIDTIDGKPATEVLFEDVGEPMASDPRLMEGKVFAGLHIPSSDTRDYLIRNLLSLDLHRGQIAIADTPPTGSHIQFAIRDASTAKDDLLRMVAELKSRIKGKPKGALYFTCCGRGPFLFGDKETETSVLQQALGDDIPIAGFFANGEISHDRVYGYTGTLTVFL